MERNVIVTPDYGEAWYWLPGYTSEDNILDIPDRDTLIARAGHRSPPRYDLLWTGFNMSLEYRPDLGITSRWRDLWLDSVCGVRAQLPSGNPLIPGFPPVKELLIRYRPDSYTCTIAQARVDVYRPLVVIERTSLNGLGPLATIVGHLVEFLDIGIEKTGITWIVRFVQGSTTVWQVLLCEWHCHRGWWWVVDYQLTTVGEETVLRLLEG